MKIIGQPLLITPSITANIEVNCPDTATLVCSNGATYLRTALTGGGTHVFKVHKLGEWVISVQDGEASYSTSVNLTKDGQYEVVNITIANVYGISRAVTDSGSNWTRTNQAVGLTAKATFGTTLGSSDFDAVLPWSGIKRETMSNGDVMVKIPKFWYKRERDDTTEALYIADRPKAGFTLHPLFDRPDGEKDHVYVAAYKTSSTNRSKSGEYPQVNLSRSSMRTYARNKGAGWGLMDIAAVSAMQMLMMVEFATTNVQQTIGYGYANGNSGTPTTGTCNNVTNLTGITMSNNNGYADVVWRGIEGLWGSCWEWVDGVNVQDGVYYVCNDPSKYADNTSTGYGSLSFVGNTAWTNAFITEMGLDTGANAHVMLPSGAGSGSGSTYYCDACTLKSGWRNLKMGGRWDSGQQAGVFAMNMGSSDSEYSTDTGSRLMYIPS